MINARYQMIKTVSQKNRIVLSSIRIGLSLMEVLFAIGVLMIGLLGIASVLPVGTRNAAQALRSDITASAIENQVSNALARLDGRPSQVLYPYSLPRLSALSASLDPNYPTAPTTDLFGNSSLSNLAASVPIRDYVPDPMLPQAVGNPPPAICIDPSFITAATNFRPTPLNYYDRTKFPCFDYNYDALTHPGIVPSLTSADPITPRMFRVSLSAKDSVIAPEHVVAKALLSERDGLPLNKPKDSTLPTSLFFRPLDNPLDLSRADAQRSGAFSSMVTVVPSNRAATNYDVSIIVFENRQLTTNTLGFDTTNPALVFPLQPFATISSWVNQATLGPDSKTYPDEVMCDIVAAPDIIDGGLGTFTYEHSSACNPEIKSGQWIMLARFDATAGINRYAWYRVSQVIDEPVEIGNVYRATIEVRGMGWVFHPAMVTGAGTAIPLPPTPPPPLEYEFKRRSTIMVKMPRVVSVRTVSL
ncbi:MAG TPA: hypothetical protein DDZ51_06350 [Planctomycetaceae bacterium]|nr:hypothetical protein [Planctomycetaceae bacterium]